MSLQGKGKPGDRPEPLGAAIGDDSDQIAPTWPVLRRGNMKRERKSRKARNNHSNK